MARRILLVEDHAESAAVLQTYFDLEGYDCAVCPEGSSALEAIDSFAPSAIILDVGLPGRSGLELARAIRARPDGTRLVLIGYSGYGKDDDQQQALDAGMDAYFVKPADANELLSAIEQSARRIGLQGNRGLD